MVDVRPTSVCSGHWRVLSGNDVGGLLIYHLWNQYKQAYPSAGKIWPQI